MRKKETDKQRIKVLERKLKASKRKHKAYIKRKAREEVRVKEIAKNDGLMYTVLTDRGDRKSWKKIGKKHHISSDVLRRAAIAKYGYKHVERPKAGHRSGIEIMHDRVDKLIAQGKIKAGSPEEYVRQKY